MSCMGARRAWLLVLLSLALVTSAAAQPASLPPRLEQYLNTTGGLSAGQRQRLLAGQPITKLLNADATKEVAVFGAIWIAAPIDRYIAAVQDIANLETGRGYKTTTRISMPPRLEDFDALRLTDEDFKDLRQCRVADCAIKLGEAAIRRFQTEIDWRNPAARAAADRLMRQLALEYVTRYLNGGHDQLAVYRDGSRPIAVADEFAALVDGMPALTMQPDLRRHLLEYPAFALPDSTSFLYWQETEFGLKPTIRISHVTIRKAAVETIVASKMLYASHYFWAGLEIRALIPDPARGDGFWFVTVGRSRSDGLSGFSGIFVRRRVRSAAQEGALAGLRKTKDRLERNAVTK